MATTVAKSQSSEPGGFNIDTNVYDRSITMNAAMATAPATGALPDDDPTRKGATARPNEDQTLRHWGIAGTRTRF
jgi:hypothetical protein